MTSPERPATPRDTPDPGPLSASLAVTHEQVRTALADTRPAERFAGIAWVSAHVSAVDRILLPLAHEHLSLSQRTVDAHRRGARQIHHLIRHLESHYSHNAVASGGGSPQMRARLGDLIRAQAAEEAGLGAAIEAELDQVAALAAAVAYQRALEVGPTRPHPHAPHAAVFLTLAYHLNAARDHLLDALDSRPVPPTAARRGEVRADRWRSRVVAAQRSPVDSPALDAPSTSHR